MVSMPNATKKAARVTAQQGAPLQHANWLKKAPAGSGGTQGLPSSTRGGRAVMPTANYAPTRLSRWQGGQKLNPWQGGKTALADFDPGTVDVTADPGYDFRMQEGLKAIRRRAAAGSGARGGATLKALTRYGQDMASQEYGNAYDRAVNKYMMDRQNVMDERGMRRDDFLLNQDVDRENRAYARDDYMIGRDNEIAERGFAERDFDMGMRRAEAQRERELQDYNISRQNVIDQRGFAVEDRAFFADQMQRSIDNVLRQAAFDLTKYEAGHGVRQRDAQLALDKYGIDKEVEFRAREQKRADSQNRFNNLLTGIGLVTSFF